MSYQPTKRRKVKSSHQIPSHQKYENNCNHLKKCQSFKRIQNILQRYHVINGTHNEHIIPFDIEDRNKLLIELLDEYPHLINDYHHILMKHLSHSNHETNMKNFNYIHNKCNITCNIQNCQLFKSHNINRLQSSADHDDNSLYDENISFYIDLLNSIHIYFIHGIDAGFRSNITPNIMHSHPNNKSMDQDMINQLLLFNFGDREDIIYAIRLSTDKHDVNQIIDILKQINEEKEKQEISQLDSSEFYEDEQMIGFKNQNDLYSKRKLLTSYRGEYRMKNNKFSTQIATSTKTAITERPRRTSSKMNKLLPNPDIIAIQKQKSDKYDVEDLESATFKILMNKELNEHGIDEHILDELNEWMDDNHYDTDAIIEDIKIARLKGDDESNIHQYCQLKNQIKCYNNIKEYVINNGPDLMTKSRADSGEEMKRYDSRDPYGMEDLKSPEIEETTQEASSTANSDMNNNQNKSHIKRGNKEYVFGHRYYYWPSYKSHAWYIPARYANLKEEMLQLIPANIYNQAYIKAIQLLEGSDILKKMASNSDGDKLGYDIPKDLPLSVANILSIIFYTDYDELAVQFKSTFCKTDIDETDLDLKLRHSVFYNWSKIMTETIELYGVPLRFTKIDALYHNTSFMHYGLFTATFNTPTSMTRYLEVAAMYCEDDGVILEMCQYPKIRPKYFDCSLVSNFAYEHELLFIASDKSMDIQSIRIIRDNEDHKLFIKAMRLFNKITNGTILSISERWEITDSDYIIIQRLINNENNNFPKYMNESFHQFCSDKKRIKMDCYCLKDTRYYNKYAPFFMHQYHQNLLKFDYICKLFPNVECIESWDTGEIKSLYLTALKNILIKINKMGNNVKLKKIIIHCDPIDSNFNLFKHRFKSQGWIIKRIESWQIALFRNKNS